MTVRLEGGPGRWVPGLRTLREYQRSWLASDLVAGLVLTALLVPVGMGYAQAAGLPPITGLYATIVPLVAYAILGPSRVMVLGPDSSLAAVIAAVILPLGGDDPETAVALAGALAVITGLIILVAGIARLGFVTELLSRPVQLGYLYGIAVTILVGQLPKLCGFSIEGRGLLTEIRDFAQGVADGQVNRAALAVGLAGIVVILVLRRFWRTVPGVAVAVVVGIAAVAIFDLEAEGVEVVGVLPEGLPTLVFPSVDLADLGALFSGALGIALVAVADTTVLSQSLAAQRNESVDPDQELRALGAANLASGLFQGFAISSSSSRTPVAVSAGARSQLTPLVGAVAITLLLVFAPGLLRDLPLPMLAAIVITAAIGLIDVAAVRRLHRVRRSEFVLWLAAFGGVALLGVLMGIFTAILLSLADFVRRAWRPHDAVLGREDELKGYHDIDRHPSARQVPGLLLYRFDAPLFFANAAWFRRRVKGLVAEAAHPVRWVVVAAEPVTDVDSTAADTLDQLLRELREQQVTLAFAELKGPVKDRLRRYGLYDAIGPDHFLPTIGTAVNAYVTATGTTWVDWEERPAPDPDHPG
ncbi:MAG TPA: sulfate permease [Actinomycetota bacterium]|jgi:high affinity sulfate transporter 1|nr:sulfate permease [Actinomycetota bacterium]